MSALKQYLDEERGRLKRLAAALGVTPPAICQWHQVPAERVLHVERVTGVSRHDLRPDIYPREAPAADAAA